MAIDDDPGGDPGGGDTPWSTVVRQDKRPGRPPSPKPSDPTAIHVRVVVTWQGRNYPNKQEHNATITKLNQIYTALLAKHDQSICEHIEVGRIQHLRDTALNNGSIGDGSSLYGIVLLIHCPTGDGASPSGDFKKSAHHLVTHLMISNAHRTLINIPSVLVPFLENISTRMPPVNHSTYKAQGLFLGLPPSIVGDRRIASEHLRHCVFQAYFEANAKEQKGDPMLEEFFFNCNVGVECHRKKLMAKTLLCCLLARILWLPGFSTTLAA